MATSTNKVAASDRAHWGRAGDASAVSLPTPYLLFLGDVAEAGYAKTAFGLRDWAARQVRRRVCRDPARRSPPACRG